MSPLLLLLGAALAQEAELPWTVGRPLGQVSLVAASGELPVENLAPLLRATQGQIFDPQVVRTDLAVLTSTGLFSAVEAEVEEGVGFGPDGEPERVVWLSYRVLPAPELRRVHVEGSRRLPTREVRHAAGVSPGGRIFAETDLPLIERRVRERYISDGFTQVVVQAETLDAGEGQIDLVLRIQEGDPLRVGELRLGGELPLSERRVRLQLWTEGLWRGRRMDQRDLRRGQERVEALLRREGYPEARVRALTLPEDEARGVVVLVFVEPGEFVTIELSEDSWIWQRRVQGWVMDGLEGRVSPAIEDDLEARVRREAGRAGFADAEVSLRVVDGDGVDRVQVDIQPGPRYRLPRGGLRFEGSQAYSSDYLADALAEASPEVIGRQRLTEEALEGGLSALEDLYRSRGYLSAELRVDRVSRTPAWPWARIEAVVVVEEGPRTELRSLVVEGVAPELAGRWAPRVVDMTEGPFEPAAIRQLTDEIVAAHRELGYSAADARTRTVVTEDGLYADTRVEIQTGDQLFLRNVIIRGTRDTRRRIIEREVEIETGEVILPEDLSALRSELYELDTFSVVSLQLQGEGDRLRDLVIEVREQPSWSFEIGGGVATDQGVRAVGRATRRNLWGLGHRLSALGQLGYGYAGNEWRLDTSSPEWRAGLRYEVPTRHQLLFVDALLNEQEQEPTYRMVSSGADLGVELELGTGRQAVLNYGVQWRSLDDVDPGALVTPDPWLDVLDVSDPTSETLYLPSAWRRQGSLSVLVLDDQRDDPFNPRAGHLISLQLEGYDALSSGFWGVRAYGRGQWIAPLGPVALELRSQAGVGGVLGRGQTLALEDRFRLGGASTMRGYPLDSVGPKNAVAVDDLPLPSQLDPLARYLGKDSTERWVPTGGDAMLLATAELRVPAELLGLPLGSSTELVTFADVGNVFLLDPTVFTSSERIDPEPVLRYGVGVGVHFATPIGPLQLDVGFNPMYFQASWPEARGEVPVRLHVSLGAL
ncbi:MAG: BamA/TamA family outer membrane protein [Alphaproteobacteria bacterium]|nr:BamA/TamA family outer membrane protein [Alphaproteobacteria bacterium]MCB9792607.1 BamA/TamA family outer membrane protein [Alphaproteobacteria bacterium]